MDRQLAHDRVIARLAARQHGVVARAQLLDRGLSHHIVDLRVRSGRLIALHRGVYAVGHDRLRPEGRWLAAVLAVGRDAVLSHASAAMNWGLRDAVVGPVHVTLPRRTGRARRRGVRIHRPELFDAADVGLHDAIPTTTVARTLLDMAVTTRGRHLEQLVRHASQRRRFDLGEVHDVLERHPSHPGAAELAALVARLHGRGTEDLRSTLEVLFLDLCDAHGFAHPVVNGHVGGIRVDFCWPSARLVVETDGFEWHATPSSFAADRRRDQHLVLLGYRVLRFTWDEVRNEPDRVAQTVAALISARASRRP